MTGQVHCGFVQPPVQDAQEEGMIRPLFKVREPFMEVPEGVGYLGVVNYDDVKDRVQCHICGEWVKVLGCHAKERHKMTSSDYRSKFSLPLRGALCARSTARKLSKAAQSPENIARLKVMRNTLSRKERLDASWRAARSRKMRRSDVEAKSRLAFKNQIGLCQAQMAARYSVVSKIVKRIPTTCDLKKYDSKLLGAILRKHVTLNVFRKSIGERTQHRQGNQFGNLELIAALRKWGSVHRKQLSYRIYCMTHGSLPGPSTIGKYFGSWNNALAQAGLVQ